MMETITKFEESVIDADDIKTKLYKLNVGDKLKITTKYCSRIFERIT